MSYPLIKKWFPKFLVEISLNLYNELMQIFNCFMWNTCKFILNSTKKTKIILCNIRWLYWMIHCSELRIFEISFHILRAVARWVIKMITFWPKSLKTTVNIFFFSKFVIWTFSIRFSLEITYYIFHHLCIY